ncbi:RIP metalloprotease RseP [Aerococcaceae bacterium NML191292]|nr:RIP metalloprotease RseP [Aerococcaceae bacterium NML191292]MCW6680714.1 RIP metalloprotease RseP [Aerococcaceae bacterium NML130460]
MLKTVFVFLLVFSVIVVIHEFGHFYFARRAGILVREFAIGMGPKLFAKQGKDGVMYTIRMLPFGGYVRLAGLGEDEDAVKPGMTVGLTFNETGEIIQINTRDQAQNDELPVQVDSVDLREKMSIQAIPIGQEEVVSYSVNKKARIIEPDGTSIQVAPIEVTYNSATPWHKMLTNVAGPINNFILSIIVFMIVGLTSAGVANQGSYIGQVVEGERAALAGLQAGDHVVAINDASVNTWMQLVMAIHQAPNETLNLTVKRGNVTETIQVKVAAEIDERTKETIGRIGITPEYKTSIVDRLMFGFTQTWAVIVQLITVIASMFKQGFNINQFGGPVAIAQATGQVAKSGWQDVLMFMGMISANLGVFNLLPIPALDGGKIVLNTIEAVRGKPISQEKEGIVTLIGVAILVAFMIAVTWNDISRLFR